MRRLATSALLVGSTLLATWAGLGSVRSQMSGCPPHSYGTAEIKGNVRTVTCHCVKGYREAGNSCVPGSGASVQGPAGPAGPIPPELPQKPQVEPLGPAEKAGAAVRTREECYREQLKKYEEQKARCDKKAKERLEDCDRRFKDPQGKISDPNGYKQCVEDAKGNFDACMEDAEKDKKDRERHCRKEHFHGPP